LEPGTQGVDTFRTIVSFSGIDMTGHGYTMSHLSRKITPIIHTLEMAGRPLWRPVFIGELRDGEKEIEGFNGHRKN
jgi:hypothetical protein